MKVENTRARQENNKKDKSGAKRSACKKGENIHFELACLGLAAAVLYPGGAHKPTAERGGSGAGAQLPGLPAVPDTATNSETASFLLTLAAQGLRFIST